MATTVLWTPPNAVSPLILRGDKKLFCMENGPGIYPFSFASLSRLGVLLDAPMCCLDNTPTGWGIYNNQKYIGSGCWRLRVQDGGAAERAERGREQGEAKVDDDVNVRYLLTRAQLRWPNCLLKIPTPHTLALQTFITCDHWTL